jgi:hypothetical protein
VLQAAKVRSQYPVSRARDINGTEVMPRGSRGEKRRADGIGNAVHVMRVAMGEIDEPHGKRTTILPKCAPEAMCL